ncbi:MAG: 5'-3' exonuclease H3TH domain-containing protein, partial [Ruminococcus sp.]|nr:5'-3' exonuclease H3TH domain-containing protein [Ruminococcus sp.]
MKLLAIDGNSILNRAFYGIKLLSNKKGVFTNAIFGFMNIYMKNFDDVRPDAVAVAFDLKAPTFRHKAVDYYKANRKGMPEELAQQLPLIKELLRLMGIAVVECEGYEADDVLGTLSKLCSDSGSECYVLTGDRDSLQLIDERVTVLLATNKETIHYTPERFREDYGFEPIRLIDLKALMGDSSDNIKGVAGIGEKTAKALIQEFGTLEGVYAGYEESGLTKGVKAKLAAGVESAKESKWLATIVRDAPINSDLEAYRLGEPDNAGVSRLLTELEMYKLLDKLGISASEGEAVPERRQDEYTPVEVTEQELTAADISGFTDVSYLFDGERLTVLSGTTVYTSADKKLISAFFASDCDKITSDAKPHYRWAMAHGGELRGVRSDVPICGYLLNTSASD